MDKTERAILLIAYLIARNKVGGNDIDQKVINSFKDDGEKWWSRIIVKYTEETLLHGKSVDEAVSDALEEFTEYLVGDKQ